MAKYRTYTVKAGDCLSVIAERELGSGSRWREIQKLNNLPSDVIYTGMVLKIEEIKETVPANDEVKKALTKCLDAIGNLPEFKELMKLL